MRKKRDFQLYTFMWVIAILILLALLLQNVGDARIINYSGLVRGATQKLIKEELNDEPNDKLIQYLDDIIYDLQTGKGSYNLNANSNTQFHVQLNELKLVWEEIKEEIPRVRSGEVSSSHLYSLSQQHFELADALVLCAENYSDRKIILSIVLYTFSLLLSVTIFWFFNKRNQQQLSKSISTDSLTGSMNRIGFEDAGANLLRQHPAAKYVIIEFDIDNFKVINETLGYSLGDQLLCRLADALSHWLGDASLYARINADDFVLLTGQTDTLLSDLKTLLAQTVQDQTYLEAFGGVHFTFGCYHINSNDEQIRTIMDKANMAHKTAKLHGSKDVIWYDEQLLQKLKMENRYKEQMHRGMINEEFKIYLQPKLILSTMDVAGAEALVRWDFPGLGLVYPDEFIPLFEKNGSIVQLDFYMLEKVCIYIRGQLNQGADPMTISVNFSRVTLYQQDFFEKFTSTVDKYSLPHNSIEVEITESAFNRIADSVLQVLANLQNAGYGISMDDFGAGYSNLNMLSKFPIQIIKLDKEFISETDRNKNMKGIVACAVELAHTMNIKVVCEGVERAEHIAFLREIGCDYIQGYYISKPIPQEEFMHKYQHLRPNPSLPCPKLIDTGKNHTAFDWKKTERDVFDTLLSQTYPGFVSLRDEKHVIVYLNQNFRDWIAKYTDVNPIGKTNVELAAIVPENVADTFLQCHDGSLELQKTTGNTLGLKKIIEFKGALGTDEPSHYFDVLKYWVSIEGIPYIFTIAYDITELYVENRQNLETSVTDSLTSANNRRYLEYNLNLFYGHYAALLDLDHFKMINDKEGHNIGDKILCEFVNFIRQNVPGVTAVVRLGGDEFLAVFRNGETKESIMASLHKARALYQDIYAQYTYLSFSTGVDVIGHQLNETIARLDKEMYEDKRTLHL